MSKCCENSRPCADGRRQAQTVILNQDLKDELEISQGKQGGGGELAVFQE